MNLLSLVPLLLPLFGSGAPAVSEDGAPKVLIVSPEAGGIAEDLQEFLDEHDISATIANWSTATAEHAQGFDLVLVCGEGNTAERFKVVLDYDRPVLGVGPYGCAYFGLLDLKPGSPHT